MVVNHSFAASFSPAQLLVDAGSRRRFFEQFLDFEGKFIRPGIGFADRGLTFDGAHILDDGSLQVRSHSNPSKEALHLALLSLAVRRDGLVAHLIDPNDALQQLRLKADSLERCRSERPELCGFMPWFDTPSGGRPIEPDIAVRYNGMFAWTLYFARHVLEDVGEFELSRRFDAHLQAMRKAAVDLCYKGGGKIATHVVVPPRGATVVKSQMNCDDPFAGEMFCLFLDLLADWSAYGDDAGSERDLMWRDPDRAKWISWGDLEVNLENSSHRIMAIRRSTFSCHEEWKYLFLPYASVNSTRRSLCLAETLRTWWSRSRKLPGLLGDCHISTGPGNPPASMSIPSLDRSTSGVLKSTNHVTAFGIPGPSSLQEATARADHVAGNGMLGLLLVDEGVGAAWLCETLSANEGMQTPWGICDSCSADGSKVCPVLTWDVKATTSLAILGGLGMDMRRYLEADGLLHRFNQILERLYDEALGGRQVPGETLGPAPPPSVQAPEWCAADASRVSKIRSFDLEYFESIRGKKLPASDSVVLERARVWAENHQGEPGSSPYCSGRFEGEMYSDWYTGDVGHFCANLSEDRHGLYENVVACYGIGAPMVMLARQAPIYWLFLDVDVFGSEEVRQVCWNADGPVLLEAIVESLWELYPQFREGLEVAVFESSGYCTKYEQYKASWHIVFPGIAVDRPHKCWPTFDKSCENRSARHLDVRNHIVGRISEASALENSRISELREGLLRCSGWARACVYEDASDNGLESVDDDVFLNDWTEVFDENPLWHEPDPVAATGLRLPFTDKPHEGRPKKPLGRWLFSSQNEGAQTQDVHWPPPSSFRRLRDLEPIQWVKLGDISVCSATEVTRMTESALHPCARADRLCRNCSDALNQSG